MPNLENLVAAAMQQPDRPPPVVHVQPFNDIQLVALIAAHQRGVMEAPEAVAWAVEVVAEAIVQSANLDAAVARRRLIKIKQ